MKQSHQISYGFLLVFVLILSACSNKKEPAPNFFSDLELRSDTLDIKTEVKVNVEEGITLGSGRKIKIASNSFLYEDGSPVTEPVELIVKEYNDYAAMLSAGLQTISTEGLLETAGMYYLEAQTKSGKAVKVNAASPLFLTGDVRTKNSDFQLYEGLASDTGLIWDQPIPSYKLGPIHFGALFYHYTSDNYIEDLEHPLHVYWNKKVMEFLEKDLDLVKYQNSIAASPAFIERFIQAIYVFSSLVSDDKAITSYTYNKKETYGDFRVRIEYLGKFFKSLPLENLSPRQLDSLLLQRMVVDSIHTIKHYKKKGYFSAKTPKMLHKAIQHYRNLFCKTKAYTKFDFTQKIEIDTAYLQHINSNGYAIEGSEMYERGNSSLLLWLDSKKEYNGSLNATWGRKSYSNVFKYPLLKLGWYNIDRLIKEGLEEVEILVNVNTDNPNATVALLLKDKKVAIYEAAENGKCVFRRKLPKEAAILLASITVKDQTFFAQKAIEIGTDSKIDLDLKASTKEAVQKALEEFESN